MCEFISDRCAQRQWEFESFDSSNEKGKRAIMEGVTSLEVMVGYAALEVDLLLVLKHESTRLFVSFAQVSNQICLLFEDVLAVALIPMNKRDEHREMTSELHVPKADFVGAGLRSDEAREEIFLCRVGTCTALVEFPCNHYKLTAVNGRHACAVRLPYRDTTRAR